MVNLGEMEEGALEDGEEVVDGDQEMMIPRHLIREPENDTQEVMVLQNNKGGDQAFGPVQRQVLPGHILQEIEVIDNKTKVAVYGVVVVEAGAGAGAHGVEVHDLEAQALLLPIHTQAPVSAPHPEDNRQQAQEKSTC